MNKVECVHCHQLKDARSMRNIDGGEYCRKCYSLLCSEGRIDPVFGVMKQVGKALEQAYPWGYSSEDNEP